MARTIKEMCPNCAGTGRVDDTSRPQHNSYGTTYPHKKTCLVCAGSGKVDKVVSDPQPNGNGGGGSGCVLFAVLIVMISGVIAFVFF